MTPFERTRKQSDLTAREHAAIQLRVPDSGTDWLDAMIRKSLRQEFAATAMLSLAPEYHASGRFDLCIYACARADALMDEMKKDPE